MSVVANPFVAVIDANVLFPFRTRDVLLTFAHDGLFRARFTAEIIDEWTRSLIALKPHLNESVERQAAIIRREFEECFVTGHMPLVNGLELPDPDDRHVLAAAIRCSAQVIVTENRRDFPAIILDQYGVEVLTADELFPSEAARSLRKVRCRYKSPPMTASEFLFDLTKSGLPKLAALAKRDIEVL